MKKKQFRHLDLEIDKLTNSIENSVTGEVFDTEIKTIGLIREPKNVDLIVKSEPWSKDDLAMLRDIMKKQRERKAKFKSRLTKKSGQKARTQKPMASLN